MAMEVERQECCAAIENYHCDRQTINASWIIMTEQGKGTQIFR